MKLDLSRLQIAARDSWQVSNATVAGLHPFQQVYTAGDSSFTSSHRAAQKSSKAGTGRVPAAGRGGPSRINRSTAATSTTAPAASSHSRKTRWLLGGLGVSHTPGPPWLAGHCAVSATDPRGYRSVGRNRSTLVVAAPAALAQRRLPSPGFEPSGGLARSAFPRRRLAVCRARPTARSRQHCPPPPSPAALCPVFLVRTPRSRRWSYKMFTCDGDLPEAVALVTDVDVCASKQRSWSLLAVATSPCSELHVS